MMLKDRRSKSLVITGILLILALLNPTIPIKKDRYNLVFVIDITQSMNAKDYHLDNQPADRLSFVKASLQQVLATLPCNSQIGLGLFTTKNIFLLFEPLEICAHYSAIENSLMRIDWRMAWAADSHIARGIFTGIKDIDRIKSKPALVFLTDGQQTPISSKEPPFLLEKNKVRGLLVGVGNLQPVQIPKFDDHNIQTGFWQIQEAERKNNLQSMTGPYLSSVQEQSLQRLAGITGMGYHHLDTTEKFLDALAKANLSRIQIVEFSLDWLFSTFALLIFIASYFISKHPNN